MRNRIANYLSFAAMAVPVAMSRVPDVIVTMTDPPICGAVGMLAAGARRRPFIYWVQDLHPDVAIAAGLINEGRLTRSWRAGHARVLRQASVVVVLGHDMAERAVAAGARPSSVRVVHGGAPLGPEPNASDQSHPVAMGVRSHKQFVVLHAGNLGFSGAWDTLLSAADAVPEQVGFSFVGSGADAGRIRRRAADAGISNVSFHEFQPADRLRYVLAAGDVHIVTIRRGLEGLVVPSKLYGILAAGRPVLVVAAETTEAAKLVRQHRCGLVADPDHPDEVVAAIRWCLDHPSELRKMGERARSCSARFSRSRTLSDWAEIVEEGAGAPTRQPGWPGDRRDERSPVLNVDDESSELTMRTPR